MFSKLKYLVSGIIIGAVLFSGVSGLAASFKQTIEVNYLPLKYFVDGVEKKPSANQQGFVYQGTTYVPLRFVGESLNQKVAWEGKTTSIYIGKKPQGSFTRLESLEPLTTGKNDSPAGYSFIHYDTFKTVLGAEFFNGIRLFDGSSEYLLNGEYTKFEAMLAPSSYHKGKEKTTAGTVMIYADGELVYQSGNIASDLTEPLKISLDLTGVLRLKIVSYASARGELGLIEPKLY
jgi:hypothetical protein